MTDMNNTTEKNKMERRHGYSLYDYSIKDEDKEKVFDLCEAFMTCDESVKIENDDWKILGEQCATISVMNKHTGKTHEVNIDIDKEIERDMDAMYESIRKYEEEMEIANDEILKKITLIRGEEFADDIKICAKESEVCGPWEFVNKPGGTFQEEDEFGTITGMWVDQWCNGGYVGDDFQGHIYIEIEKDKYLKMQYAC